MHLRDQRDSRFKLLMPGLAAVHQLPQTPFCVLQNGTIEVTSIMCRWCLKTQMYKWSCRKLLREETSRELNSDKTPALEKCTKAKELPEENTSVMFLWLKMEKYFIKQCDCYLQIFSFNKYLLIIYYMQTQGFNSE